MELTERLPLQQWFSKIPFLTIPLRNRFFIFPLVDPPHEMSLLQCLPDLARYYSLLSRPFSITQGSTFTPSGQNHNYESSPIALSFYFLFIIVLVTYSHSDIWIPLYMMSPERTERPGTPTKVHCLQDTVKKIYRYIHIISFLYPPLTDNASWIRFKLWQCSLEGRKKSISALCKSCIEERPSKCEPLVICFKEILHFSGLSCPHLLNKNLNR